MSAEMDDYQAARAEYVRCLAWWPRVPARRMRDAEVMLIRRLSRAPSLRELAEVLPELRVRLPVWERMIAAEQRLGLAHRVAEVIEDADAARGE